jgi:hypothetical protein
LRWVVQGVYVDIRIRWLVLVSASALMVSAHDTFTADHGVRDILWAEAFRQTACFAHRAEAGVIAQESVYTLRVEDVVTWEFAHSIARFIGRRVSSYKVI